KTVFLFVFMLMVLTVFPVLASVGNVDSGTNKGTGAKEDPYIVPETVESIKIDGKLEEKVWDHALKMDLLYETWPRDNVTPLVKTECYIIHDKANLYVGFRAFDPDPSKIRAYFFERDNIIFDDFVMVFLDTFNDERRAYGLRSNPHGVQFDDIRSRRGASLAWDAIYDSVGKIYDWGYAVEMKIPFNQLRFQRTKEDQVWGFKARRIYPRKYLFHIDSVKNNRNNFCQMCQFVKIKGFKGVKSGRNIEVVPTLTAFRTDVREDFPIGGLVKLDQKVEGGITARWGITPNMTLSGTVNPDFSHVEADSLQLDINTPFALSYTERRPFFYEGSDFFTTNFNAMYTRTMRDPSWGVKLTGKAGANTIGAYVVRDTITNLIFPGSQGSLSTSLDMNNMSSAFRYKRDFGSNYTVGLMVTDREGDDYFNRVVGVDTDFRLTQKDRVQFQYLGSSTQYPDQVALNPQFGQEQGEFGGSAFYIKYSHDTRNWDFNVNYRSLTAGFRADIGFMPQVDYRQAAAGTSYTWVGTRQTWYSELKLSAAYTNSQDQDGNLLYSGANFYFDVSGPLQSAGQIALSQSRQAYFNREFDLTNVNVNFNIKPSGALVLVINCNFGDQIDYSNIREGKIITLSPGVTLKPNRHMQLKLNHIYQRLSAAGARLYTANISQFTGVYHFNVRTYLRAILQYVNYNRNPDNYLFPVGPKTEQLFTQLLFSYKINPRTVAYLGYSDGYLGARAFELTQTDRTFFLKLSYALTL
ncbi:MAG: carbohydrate binding family 9 domain-containing protein, partial [bacterium]|nr:carbohydrate binding family 9 domain-containing protein [bacterium]